jgi:hypothetical protein
MSKINSNIFKSLAFSLAFVALPAHAYFEPRLLVQNDAFVCLDDVSGESSTITITNDRPYEASITVRSKNSFRRHSPHEVKVSIDTDTHEYKFVVDSINGTYEEWDLARSLSSGAGEATYLDRGDSRAIDCDLVSVAGGRLPLSELLADGKTLYFQGAFAHALVKHPVQSGKNMPKELLRILADNRMKSTVAEIQRRFRRHNRSFPELAYLEKHLKLETRIFDGVGMLWITNDADDRGNSSYQALVTFEVQSGRVIDWGPVSFVEHP